MRGRLILLMRLRVAVSQGSTLEFSTTLHVDRGAKAAAEAGSNIVGIMSYRFYAVDALLIWCGMFHRNFNNDGRADQAEAKR